MLKLMYITNDPAVANIAERTGVDRIFVDMEYIGKSLRQGGMDTVQSHHTPEDVRALRASLRTAELLVRCNPIHDAGEEYGPSAEEIDVVVAAGADVIMLPYFKTVDEVKTFVALVGGRAKTMLLFETPEAVAAVEDILAVDGIDEVFVGLNDLSLGYGMKFMFELLADGTVERLCNIFRDKGVAYGFGGIAAPGKGMLPAEKIIAEHYRLGSTCVILSRSFCDVAKIGNLEQVASIFEDGMRAIRACEEACRQAPDTWETNREDVVRTVKKIAEQVRV